MGKVEQAIQNALRIAKDDSHGYDQINRWGADYDCSSFVITCFQDAGIKVKDAGATYTGNMLSAFKKVGFVEVPINDRKRGDVLLNKKKHTALYLGDGQMVQASINEKGTIKGGKKGDQTGKEIGVVPYKNYPWDVCLRYPEKEESEVKNTVDIEMPTLQKGAKGEAVRTLQILLNAKYGTRLDTDGSFGTLTYNAVVSYQRNHNPQLTPVDGFVGQGTWSALLK